MSVAATDSKTSYLLDKLQSLSGVIPIGAFLADLCRNLRAFHSDSVPRALRHLHLVDRQVERHRASMDGQLAVRAAAVDRFDRVRIHRLGFVNRAVSGPRRHL